jgi:hypothetical protein
MEILPVVRVGGVPEHFNYPWILAQERGLFEKHGVRLEWVEQKEGTGQMIKSVRPRNYPFLSSTLMCSNKREIRCTKYSHPEGTSLTSFPLLFSFLSEGQGRSR